MLDAVAGGKGPLELIDLRPFADVPRANDLGQRRDVVVPEVVARPKGLRADRWPAVNRETLAHRPPPVPSPRCLAIILWPRAPIGWTASAEDGPPGSLVPSWRPFAGAPLSFVHGLIVIQIIWA